jgi:hypothetical protein
VEFKDKILKGEQELGKGHLIKLESAQRGVGASKIFQNAMLEPYFELARRRKCNVACGGNSRAVS